MLTMIVTALAALVPLVLALMEAYATHQKMAAPGKRDEEIDQAFVSTDEMAVARKLHELRDRLRRRQDSRPE